MEQEIHYPKVITVPPTIWLNKDVPTRLKYFYGVLYSISGIGHATLASNSQLAELTFESEKTISRWLTELEQLGYVKFDQYGISSSRVIQLLKEVSV